ncbi:MAG: hypothetical protein HY846_03020 [Nitrosomonadales bacterium]|nr:hypothetical protein [Nitrosomonadales bacterium]
MQTRQLAPIVLVLAGAAIAAGACLQALNFPFLSDDETYLVSNSRLAELQPAGLWKLFVEPYNAYSEFLPLRELSYWLDLALFGLTPAAFRIHGILLYLLCLPLVYGATLHAWRYFRPADAAGAPSAAAAVTALFAVHPAHVEAVVWISGRKDVLSGMFSLLALWLAMTARRERGLSRPHAAAAIVALLAAMLSKASAVAVAPVIALIWFVYWREVTAAERRRSLLLWPLAVLVLPAFLAASFAAAISTKIPIHFGTETITRTLAILGWLARVAVTPEGRHFIYPVLEDPWLPVMAAAGVAALAAAGWGAVAVLRRRSLEGFALAVFALLCLPSLQLVPYAVPSLVSDRFVFLALWPVILLIVVLAWRLKPLPRAALLLAVALPWSIQTIERPRDWRSGDALIEPDVRAHPGHYGPASWKVIGLINGGLFREAEDAASRVTDAEFRDIMTGLARAGHAASAGSPQEAMASLWNMGQLLKIMPAQAGWNLPMFHTWVSFHYTLAMQWKNLSARFPDDAPVRYNTGLWLLNTHRSGEAAIHLRAAVDSQHLPEAARGAAYRNLGLALLNSGQTAEAETRLHAALEQAPPDLRAHCLLSGLYKKIGRLEDAAQAAANCPKEGK